ncbi:MAG: hypothetical protein EAX86_09480 [Candidatus Heimdallarchaeota archaeon]|nr:hypothetical protein [Candidatus Heimdallarchaeota archaeon]
MGSKKTEKHILSPNNGILLHPINGISPSLMDIPITEQVRWEIRRRMAKRRNRDPQNQVEAVKIVCLGQCDQVKSELIRNFVMKPPEQIISDEEVLAREGIRNHLECFHRVNEFHARHGYLDGKGKRENIAYRTLEDRESIKRISLYDIPTHVYIACLSQENIDYEMYVIKPKKEIGRNKDAMRQFRRELASLRPDREKYPNFPSTLLAEYYFLFFCYSDQDSFDALESYVKSIKELHRIGPSLTIHEIYRNPKFFILGIFDSNNASIISPQQAQEFAEQHGFSLLTLRETDFALFTEYVLSILNG